MVMKLKNNILIRRFLAYLFDFMVVSLITAFIAYLPFLNPFRNSYTQKYNEMVELIHKYEKEEVSLEEYEVKYREMYYDLNSFNINYTIVDIVVLIAYFGIFEWQWKGQTLGKKLMKIKVTSVDDKPVGVFSYCVRAVILNNIVITFLQLLVILFFNKDTYYPIYSNINLVGYVLLYLIVFFALVRKDQRGMHDLITGTQVVLENSSKEEEVVVIKKKESKKSTKSKK